MADPTTTAQSGRVEVGDVRPTDVVDVTLNGAMLPAFVGWLDTIGFRLVPWDVIGVQDPDGIPGFMTLPNEALAARIRKEAGRG